MRKTAPMAAWGTIFFVGAGLCSARAPAVWGKGRSRAPPLHTVDDIVCHSTGLGGGRYPAPGRRGRRPLRMVAVTVYHSPHPGRSLPPGYGGPGRPALRRLMAPFAMQPALAVAVTWLRAAGGVGPYGGYLCRLPSIRPWARVDTYPKKEIGSHRLSRRFPILILYAFFARFADPYFL